MEKYVIERELTGEDFRRLRNLLGMTQKEFASLVGSSQRTVETWETRDEPVTGPIAALADILFRWPDLARKLTLPEKPYGLRLYYMYKHLVCTVIDVDEINQRVEVHNYIDSPLFRAFGVHASPSYEEYQAFLESRCFPETRDKLSVELDRLGIPFYDPILIIEKTEGRMAEDDFWLRIER